MYIYIYIYMYVCVYKLIKNYANSLKVLLQKIINIILNFENKY